MDYLLTRWNEVLKELESLITAITYDLYIETLEPVKVDNNKLIVLSNSSNNKEHVLKFEKNILLKVVKNHFDNVEDLIVLEPSEKEAFLEDVNKVEDYLETTSMFNEQNKLNEKYTFDNFVVGKSNQVVYSACVNVAKNPGLNFNPLYIYGGVGLGKTHLLNAIGNYIRKNNKELKLLYVTCEQFMNDFTKSIREKTIEAFRKKYRDIDVLMVDDIQFIANKTGTQEEFFNTFNDLYQNNKQIILASDKHPKNMETLEDRLKSRFSGGLTQDIQKPDFETRLAILQKKVELKNYNIDNDVLLYLAEKIDSNIRELEGSLNRVISLSMLINKPKATMEEAKEALKDLEITQSQGITIDKIMTVVCRYYNIKKEDLVGKKKNKEVVDPRQNCIYIITELLDVPLITIGEAFGGRDHTTIIHARDKIAENIKTNKSLKTNIDDLIAMIKAENS